MVQDIIWKAYSHWACQKISFLTETESSLSCSQKPTTGPYPMDLKEIGWKGVEWSHLAQDRDQYRLLRTR